MTARPNILIFMTDQQQERVVACGHPCRTPHVDRLAREGLRLTAAYTPAPHCCPARASFMTGLAPSRHGVYNNVKTDTAINWGLRAGVDTFSAALAGSGYEMVYTGKWHVSGEENPADRGWRELEVVIGANRRRPKGRRVLDRDDVTFDTGDAPRGPGEIVRPGYTRLRLYGSYPDRGPRGYDGTADDRIVQSAVKALPALAQGDAPWCLFVGTRGPHDPFVIPERFAKMYNPGDVPLPPNYGDGLEDKPRIYQRMRRQLWDQLDEDEVRASIAHYWGYCTMMDELFGQVLAALETVGQAEETLVIFLSDHGEYAGAHGLYFKGVPAFDEAYHIPCVMRWPAGVAPGQVRDDFVSLMDFAPTFLELAGCDVPGDLSGRSLVPLWNGPVPSDWPDDRYTQLNGVELYYTQRVVATKRHKYVFNGFDFDELYDLERDPHELTNRIDDPGYEDIKKDLIRRLWRHAYAENDHIFNGYGTVGLLPYGPGLLREDGQDG